MKVFISNVNVLTKEVDLVNFLNPFLKDPIHIESVKLVKDPRTKLSRGFAYVSFYSEEDLTTVLNLNDPILNKRALRITKSNR
jgi:RNA recognition motif-containing protein